MQNSATIRCEECRGQNINRETAEKSGGHGEIGTSATERFAEIGRWGFCIGGLRTAIGDSHASDGALKCGATEGTSKPTSTAARFDEPEPAATNSRTKSKSKAPS